MPTYRRFLSSNELSYFLPSRVSGVNDMYTCMQFRAPANLVSPLRVNIAWAIMRLRHPLIASCVEMKPGCYDDAQFAYTPPASVACAADEASTSVRVHTDVSGVELCIAFLNGPRTLSSSCLSRLAIACGAAVAPGVHEFHMLFMGAHLINDTRTACQALVSILELLGGTAADSSKARTDSELARLLDDEWERRWGHPRAADEVLVPATEARICGLSTSKFLQAAWRVDHQKLQRRFIGGHTFPRVKSTGPMTRTIQARFSTTQTAAILAKCKSQRVTLQNTLFAVTNFAWMRLCAQHPEINAPKALPMLLYTAISTRRYLPPVPELISSHMSLALDYHNVMLPTFLPSTDPRATFWLRCRAAQKQMFAYTRSPLLLRRSLVTSTMRGQRAKAWARIDDETDGTFLKSTAPSRPPSVAAAPSSVTAVPSLALLGLSQTGDIDGLFHPERYPSIEATDVHTGARRPAGGILVASRTFRKRFELFLCWDAAPYAPGLVEEFWGYVVDTLLEYVLEDPASRAAVEHIDRLPMGGVPTKVRGKL
ncbi:hypothetical protein DFH08DRAFT_334916 [Mycena albidolilacea]|uniref:Condensation domain-containing protein n=1 Tax=Mycena albidolilacea TaxID=1033008 RepID=A0AAD7EJ19_9AGAR|nr:hypothetical protein DFH08DRAFT_334916 [Mycena albidolilacea]